MGQAKRKVKTASPLSDGDIEGLLLSLVTATPGATLSDCKKLQIPLADKPRIAALLSGLVDAKRLYSFSKSGKESFFLRDPVELLKELVLRAVAQRPQSEPELKLLVKQAAKGLDTLLKEWLVGAVARTDLYAVSVIASGKAAKGVKAKKYALEPDVGSLLSKVVAELNKVLQQVSPSPALRRKMLVELATTLGVVGDEFGQVHPVVRRTNLSDDAAQAKVLSAVQALAEQKGSGLLRVPDVRRLSQLEKAEFDRAAVALFKERKLTLHHHDFPASLSDAEREELIRDERGTHYVGLAPTRGA